MSSLRNKGLRSAAELGADRPHGDRLRYLAGCKCFHCRRANSDYERVRQAARLAGDWNGIVDATKARAHIRMLSRRGVGRRSIQAACDIAESVIGAIRSGQKRRIRARTERRILAVTTAARAGHSFVPAARSLKLLRELLEEGFTKRFLAVQLGYRCEHLQFRFERMTAANALKVEKLHRRLMS